MKHPSITEARNAMQALCDPLLRRAHTASTDLSIDIYPSSGAPDKISIWNASAHEEVLLMPRVERLMNSLMCLPNDCLNLRIEINQSLPEHSEISVVLGGHPHACKLEAAADFIEQLATRLHAIASQVAPGATSQIYGIQYHFGYNDESINYITATSSREAASLFSLMLGGPYKRSSEAMNDIKNVHIHCPKEEWLIPLENEPSEFSVA